jgi:hypothetical protein
MTSESVAGEVSANVAATRAVFEELGRLKLRLADLKTAEDARLAHEAALSAENRAIVALQRDVDALTAEQRRRRLTGRVVTVAPPPSVARQARPRVVNVQPVATPVERPPAAPTADRRKLKKIVNRWQFQWKLDSAVLAQVNGIADDPARPLGEALALLDWRVLASPLPNESGEAHASRLDEWRGALEGYADHLRSEIDTVETRYRGVLAIWERWRKARESNEGLAEWNLFIEKSRGQKQSEITRLRGEVDRLRGELGL